MNWTAICESLVHLLHLHLTDLRSLVNRENLEFESSLEIVLWLGKVKVNVDLYRALS